MVDVDAAAVPAQTRAARPSSAAIVVTLAMLLSIQPVSTDLYLPALPALTAAFGAPIGAAQLTLSALLLTFGLGQLVMGPLSDRFGRRPVLIVGLALYTAASLGSVWAGSIDVLIAWRAVQGIGMAAAVVCARAMVRDLYEPHEGAVVISKALTGLGGVALLSPPLGGLLAGLLGWRAPLMAVSLYGAATLAFIAWRTTESAWPLNPAATRWRPMFATWATIVTHPGFRAWALLVASTYAGLFVYLAGSSFIYIEVLGSSKQAYGFWVAVCSASYLAGTFFCRRWVRARGVTGAVKIAAGFTLAGGLSMAALAAAGVFHPLAITLPQCLYAFAHGVHQPCGQAAVTGPFPRHAGAASALAGCVLAACAVAVSVWLGQAMDGSVLPVAYGIGLMSVVTAGIAWTLVSRHGDPLSAAHGA